MMVPVSFRRLLALLLTLPLPVPLLAQEPLRTQPQPAREELELSGSIQVLTLRRGRMGIVVSLEQESSDSIGALVQSVTPNGPADKAGIRSGDVIVRVNGRALASKARPGQVSPNPGMALITMGARIQPGDTMVVQYQRGTERKNATIVAGDDPVWNTFVRRTPDPREAAVPIPGELMEEPDLRVRIDGPPRMPEPMRTSGYRMLILDRPLADLEVVPLNPELGRYFGTPEGVLVINVPPDSKVGLKPGDVVFAVDGRKVRSPGQLLRTLQSYEPGESFKLEIMRLKKRETITGTASEGARR